MSAVCPVCGVAVVPGYVRCPKCHAALSLGTSTGRIKRVSTPPTDIGAGGTALPDKRFPLSAVLIAVGVAAAIILVFGLRGGHKKPVAAPVEDHEPIAATPQRSPSPRSARPVPATTTAVAAPVAAGAPDLSAVARDLEDTLRRQRLWGRVEISAPKLDVRSGSCADGAMKPAIDSRAALLRGAGLTKLRCLEQSGAVVFERDL